MKMSKWKLSGWVFGAVVAVSLLIYLWHCVSPEFAKFVGYLIGGLLAVRQVIASNRRATAAEKTAESLEKGNVAERFKNAIEHLGHKSASVRLGGVYALHHIAQENANYRERVFDILCAHIRETTTDTRKYLPVQHKHNWTKPSVEIESTLKLLLGLQESEEIYDAFAINLESAHLANADLNNANLQGADLRNTNFKFASLRRANLTNANMYNALMESVHIQDANMTGSDFTFAKLTGVNFENADLQDAIFTSANCNYCNFLSVKNLKVEQLMDVISLVGAKLPEGFEEQIKARRPEHFLEY